MSACRKEQDKSNIRCNNSTGEMKITSNGLADPTIGHPMGSIIMPNNRAIGCVNETCIPFNRINCRVDENGTMQTIISGQSTTELVIDANRRKKKLCTFNSLLWRMLVLFGIVIIVLSVLYAIEMNNKVNEAVMKELEGFTCFKRATPRDIENITREMELIEARTNCETYIKQMISEGTYHAVSLSASYMNQKIWSFNHGRMNYSEKRSKNITSDTPFPVASISKVFTVIVLRKFIDMKLVANMDDEVRKYQKSLAVNNPFNKDHITFRHLACMMSGLPREAPCYSAESEHGEKTRKDKYNMCPFNSTVMMKKLRNISLVLPPGIEPSYSNLGLGILGNVLAGLLPNQTLEEWVRTNIIKKLGLNNTGYITSQNRDIFPRSSIPSMKAPVMDWGWLRSAAGMYSSVNDLAKLGTFFLEGFKSFLTKAQLESLLNPAYVWSDGYAQGCPFEIEPLYVDEKSKSKNQMNYICYQKGGYIFGYGSLFMLIPSIKLNVNGAVASPGEGDVDRMTIFVATEYTKAFDKLLKRKGPKYKLPPDAEAYVGMYELRTFWPLISRPCNISLENNRLILQIEWLKTPLSYKSGWTLTSGYFDQSPCVLFSSGLLTNDYIFTEPVHGKSPSFVVNSISSSGYLRFDRIGR